MSVYKRLSALFVIVCFGLVACDNNTDGSSTTAVTPAGGYEVDGDKALGDANAPVTIIEYASLTCGHCATFHATSFKRLQEEYIDTGKVRFIFREFPTPPADRAAAGFMLASCFPEERYFGFIDLLFRQQNTWVTAPNASVALRDIALQSGMQEETFKACLQDQAELDRIVAVQKTATEQYGIQSTPSFVINGQTYTNRSYEDFKAIIDPLIPAQ